MNKIAGCYGAAVQLQTDEQDSTFDCYNHFKRLFPFIVILRI